MTDESYVLLHKSIQIPHPGLPQKPQIPHPGLSQRQLQKDKTDRGPPPYLTLHAGQYDRMTSSYGRMFNNNTSNNYRHAHCTPGINDNSKVSNSHLTKNPYSHLSETYWTTGSNADVDNERPNYVPSLDLTSLTNDNDENGHTNSNSNNNCEQSGSDDILFVKKQKHSFVFPPERSLSDYEVVRARQPHVLYEDPASTSPYAQMRRASVSSNNSNMGQENENNNKGTIHFSLSNPKLGKYLIDESISNAELLHQAGGDAAASEAEHVRRKDTNIQTNEKKQRDTKLGAVNGNNEPGRKCSLTGNNLQEIVNVVVVNGHSNNQTEDQVNDSNVKGAETDLKLEEIVSAKEKPKPRVTFSFHDDIQSSRSLKRYTPIKNHAKPLQGVLKKRPEPTHVPDQNDGNSASKYDYFRDAGVVFRTSQKPEYNEAGIPVKYNLHPAKSDVSSEARRTKTNSTMLTDKPPLPVSCRVSLSAAEKTAKAGTSKKIAFSGGLTYVCSNAHGRVAYFRPADGSHSSSSLKVRSRSADDINRDGRLQTAENKSTNTRPSLPFTLRRCATSEQSLIPGSQNRPMKPKIAFGSFILPKETTPRVKTAQVKFQNVDTPKVSLGSYVHTNTRRSPYAAPAQILYREDQKQYSGGHPRRPNTAQGKQQQQQQRVQQNHTVQLAQRHSAPSSYGSTRDTSWRHQRQRISIDSSPSRGQHQSGAATNTGGPKLATSSTTHHGHARNPSESGVSGHVGKSGSDSYQQRPDIATLNMIANKAKGASQYRFLASLNDKK